MTQQRPGAHPDELISASLTGELSEAERAELAVHMADCETCRETMADFSEGRRLVSGMRLATPPRDLGARVRAGIESGRFAPVPWWRRPALLVGVGASLATVTAGVMAVIVFSNLPSPPVAATGTPAASTSASAFATASLEPSVLPSAEPSRAASTPSPPPVVARAEPAAALVWTLQDVDARLEVTTPDGAAAEIPVKQQGTPVDADLSPDGDWVAFQLLGEGTGTIDTYAYRISDGTLATLGQATLPSPFARFAWLYGGEVLAYTLIEDDGAGGQADVWAFDPQGDAGPQRLTDSGVAFAADFWGGGGESAGLLAVSLAGQEPITHLLPVPIDGSPIEAVDPAAAALETAPGAFLPLVNHGAYPGDVGYGAAVVWHGSMARDAAGWRFVRGGMLYWQSVEGGFVNLGQDGEQVFPELSIQPGGAAFESARFEWGPDGMAYAVWDLRWTGTQDGTGFPAADRVYFGRLGSGTGLGPAQALDLADTEGAAEIVDVALGGGQFLALTLRLERFQGNEFAPTSELRLITRQLGTTPDGVRTFGRDGVWNGPALYPARVDPS